MEEKEKIKSALFKKAVGYDYEEREVIASASGRAERMKVITKHMPPDIAAIKKVYELMKKGEW